MITVKVENKLMNLQLECIVISLIMTCIKKKFNLNNDTTEYFTKVCIYKISINFFFNAFSTSFIYLEYYYL